MTATLEDNALLLSVLAGYDGMDPKCTPETPLRQNVTDYPLLLDASRAEREAVGDWTQEAAGRGLRIGIVKEGLEVSGLTDEVKSVIDAAIVQFEAIGADVQEVSIPMHVVGPAIWTVVTRPFMDSTGLQNRVTSYLQYSMPDVTPPTFNQKAFEVLNKHNPAVVNMFFNAALMKSKPDANRLLAKAMSHVQQLCDAYHEALEVFDVLITPVNPRVGSRHPDHDMDVEKKIEPAIGATLNTCQFNVTEHPSLSMPAGWGRVPGGPGMLPVGMQLIGKRFDEMSIFKAAAAWEVGGKGLDKWKG